MEIVFFNRMRTAEQTLSGRQCAIDDETLKIEEIMRGHSSVSLALSLSSAFRYDIVIYKIK